jgi:prepilin-type N-terminal cleavage/methylation domain-containing protein
MFFRIGHGRNRCARRPRHGFTLVELLVVVVIIAILASFLVPAVWTAIANARDAKIKVEVALLSSAVETYKAEYGAYPPADFSNFESRALVLRHINRIFPRQTDFASVAALPDLSEPQALVFWLRGFSPDPQSPFFGDGDRTPIFDFNRTQLSADLHSTAPYPVYWPQDGLETPYVYFSKTYVGKSYSVSVPLTGTARPYLLDDGTTYAAEGKFQIISAGQDGHYGVGGGQYPSGMGYAAGDRDNVVNFSQGATLENDRP